VLEEKVALVKNWVEEAPAKTRALVVVVRLVVAV
jgi:hypothetical protein